LLKQAGWNVDADGLFGAPPVTVLVGEEAHASLFKFSPCWVGQGSRRELPVTIRGRILARDLPPSPA